MSKCKKCGSCCDLIRLGKEITPGLMADSAPKGWFQKHWHLIKREGNEYLYSCDLYNAETHLCKRHKTKPKVCKDYPYVREHPNDFEKYTLEGCGYRCESKKLPKAN